MKLFRKSQDHPSPAVTAAVTMPCLKILQGLINPKDPTTSKNKASRDHKVVNVNIICRSLLCSYIHSLTHSLSYSLSHSVSRQDKPLAAVSHVGGVSGKIRVKAAEWLREKPGTGFNSWKDQAQQKGNV